MAAELVAVLRGEASEERHRPTPDGYLYRCHDEGHRERDADIVVHGQRQGFNGGADEYATDGGSKRNGREKGHDREARAHEGGGPFHGRRESPPVMSAKREPDERCRRVGEHRRCKNGDGETEGKEECEEGGPDKDAGGAIKSNGVFHRRQLVGSH